ncbi:MAG: Fe-S protein assembly co-chaperone HscB [Gammaproteobacteria bacterium]|nr:Fe-S protein assembly co-chaperone HscB [Gammaproteobacteria bacterium]
MLDFSKNYFELFGLSVGYIIDIDRLSRRYRELQQVVHPDRYANGTDQEKRLSMQGATRINEAFETLKDPIARGRYLLQLHDIEMESQQETTQDAGFLIEQLELRETLEQARHADDPYSVISDLMAGINKQSNTLIGQMAVQFETATPDQLEQAREILRKMQFLSKLRYEAVSLEDELDEAL